MYKFIGLLLVCLLIQSSTFSQYSYNTTIEKYHNEVLNLNGDTEKLEKYYTDTRNGLTYWLLAYKEFISYCFDNSEIYPDDLNESFSDWFEKAKHLKPELPYYNFTLIELSLFQAYLNIESENYFRATRELIRAFKLIDKSQTEYPEFELNNRHMLIQAAIDYLLVKNVSFLFFGEQQKSEERVKNLIQQCVNQDNINSTFKSENRLLALFVSSQVLNDKEYTFNLLEKFPIEWRREGPIELLAYSSFIPKTEKDQKKKALYEGESIGYNNRCNVLNLHYGKVLLSELNDSCIYYLKVFKNNQESDRNIIYANLQLAWYYFISNKVDSVKVILEESKGIIPKTENDKQAKYEFLNFYFWDVNLIKARVLFDGGAYNEAQSILLDNEENIKSKGNVFNVQLAYFLARIYHEQGILRLALENYSVVINSKTDNQFYYAAYSAFYSGMIYEQNNQLKMAVKSYKKCLSLKSPIYSESIHRKASNRIEYCEN